MRRQLERLRPKSRKVLQLQRLLLRRNRHRRHRLKPRRKQQGSPLQTSSRRDFHRQEGTCIRNILIRRIRVTFLTRRIKWLLRRRTRRSILALRLPTRPTSDRLSSRLWAVLR